MKKNIFLLLIMIMLFASTNVHAQGAYVDVCNSRCDYTSIDDALSDVENGVYDEVGSLEIAVSTWNEQSLSDHTLNIPIKISFNNSAAVINGNGATIKSNYEIEFNARNLDIKNTNYVFTNTNSNYVKPFLLFETSNLNIDNLNVTSNKKCGCSDFANIGIYADYGNRVIKNTTIKNFSYGIATEDGNLNVDECNLSDNYFSLAAFSTKGFVSNSKLGRMITSGDFSIKEDNDLGDLKVKMFEPTTYDDNADSICANFSNDYIYVLNLDNVSVDMKKSIEVDLKNDGEVKNILSLFKEGNINSDDFAFEVSNPEVAEVNDKGDIKLLSKGETEITASNENTKEKYTLILKVTSSNSANPVSPVKPVIDLKNPLTGTNSTILFMILLITSIGLISLYRLKKN